MGLSDFRISHSISQAELARALGITSKSYISGLERGSLHAPIRLALRIQQFSAGAVPAESLVNDEDRQLLADFRASCAQPEGAAA